MSTMPSTPRMKPNCPLHVPSTYVRVWRDGGRRRVKGREGAATAGNGRQSGGGGGDGAGWQAAARLLPPPPRHPAAHLHAQPPVNLLA